MNRALLTTILGAIALIGSLLILIFAPEQHKAWLTAIPVIATGIGLIATHGFAKVKAPLILFSCLVLTGCMTGQTVSGGKVDTRNLGHSGGTMDEDAIAASGVDQPYMLWMDANQHTVISGNPGTAMTLVLPTALAGAIEDTTALDELRDDNDNIVLNLSSPKDGRIASVEVALGPGRTLKISDIEYSISDPIRARESVISLLVDYAKQMSEDRRAEFIAFMERLDPDLAAALIEKLAGG